MLRKRCCGCCWRADWRQRLKRGPTRFRFAFPERRGRHDLEYDTMTEAKRPKKVVVAYSGGLDTSIIIPWLRENYGCEVIAMAGDIGQGDELEGIVKKAKESG